MTKAELIEKVIKRFDAEMKRDRTVNCAYYDRFETVEYALLKNKLGDILQETIPEDELKVDTISDESIERNRKNGHTFEVIDENPIF